MRRLRDYFRRMRGRQVVRPWALCAPVVLLVVASPLLRPLRWPGTAGEHELSRWATVQALVERDTQAIDGTTFFAALMSLERERQRDLLLTSAAHPGLALRAQGDVPLTLSSENSAPPPLLAASPQRAPAGTFESGGHYYSDRPPVMAFLLSWAYRAMHRMGWTFAEYPVVVLYFLTLLAVTLPAAAAAGLVYRMGRTFELVRPLRTALALIVALASGILGYATVLNPHAPAAALLLAACACLLHIAQSKEPTRSGSWMMIAGMCAALAAVIDLSAGIFLVLLVPVILAMRLNWVMRLGGVVLFVMGALPPLALHAVLTIPVTGDVLPGFLHETAPGHTSALLSVAQEDADEVIKPPAWRLAAFEKATRCVGALIGSKGLLTHWPVVLLGLAGILHILRRHWPASTKALAAATLSGALAIISVYCLSAADWDQPMFGPRWFVLFMPLVLFWAGAWLRRPHGKVAWTLAGLLLAFSVTTSVIGSAAPVVRSEPGQYTVAAAVRKMMAGEHREPGTRPARGAVVAGN